MNHPHAESSNRPAANPNLYRSKIGAFWFRSISLAFVLHLTWEFLQTPFFHEKGIPLPAIAWARLHCGIADTAIQFLAFVLVALGRHKPLGPIHAGIMGKLGFIALGIAFTAAGEIYHVGWLSDWSYSRFMPRVPILKIGWVPLLQWIVIPGLWLYWTSRRTPPRESWPANWPRMYLFTALFLILMIVLWPDLIPMYGPAHTPG